MKTRDVHVNIADIKPIGSAGFGMPLILVGGQDSDIAYAECSDIDEVVAKGFEKNSDVYNAATLIFQQDNKPETIAVMATEKKVVEVLPEIKNKEWRQLITPNADTSELGDIAKYIEQTTDKIYFASYSIQNATAMEDGAFETAVTSALESVKGLSRTVMFYYDNSDVKTPEAALVGETAGRVPGSFTYKFKTLKGLTPVALSDAKIKVIEKANSFTYVEAAGDYITSEGKTVGGEYIDVIDGKDWVLQNIAYHVQKLKNTTAKLGYSNSDITKIENATIGVLEEAFGMGIIAPKADNEESGDYSTSFKTRNEMSEEKRAKRTYDGGTFTFALAGAIHETTINGTVSI